MLSAIFDDLARGKSTLVIGLVVIAIFVGLVLYLAMFAGNSSSDGKGRRTTLMMIAPLILFGGGGWAFYSYDRYGGISAPSSNVPIWDRPGPWGESDRAVSHSCTCRCWRYRSCSYRS